MKKNFLERREEEKKALEDRLAELIEQQSSESIDKNKEKESSLQEKIAKDRRDRERYEHKQFEQRQRLEKERFEEKRRTEEQRMQEIKRQEEAFFEKKRQEQERWLEQKRMEENRKN